MLFADCVCFYFVCASLTARSTCCAVMGLGPYCSKPQKRTNWQVLFIVVMKKYMVGIQSTLQHWWPNFIKVFVNVMDLSEAFVSFSILWLSVFLSKILTAFPRLLKKTATQSTIIIASSSANNGCHLSCRKLTKWSPWSARSKSWASFETLDSLPWYLVCHALLSIIFAFHSYSTDQLTLKIEEKLEPK